MKRYRLYIWPIWLLLGMMLLAACQSDVLPGEEMGGGKPIVAHSDSSYINLRIVNNQTQMTRATEAATAKENAIYDGILCIFEGANESEAKLKTTTVIDQLINNPGTNGTPALEITQRLATGTHAYGSKLYVLALLNITSTGFNVSGNDLLFDGVSQKNKTISQIQNLVIHSVGSTEEHVGLFMSNAPQTGYIMPEVTNTYLFDTPSAAASGSKLTINVERAAARVKVTNVATSVSSFCLDGDESRHPTVHRISWALHNYKAQSYAIRLGATAAENWATSVSGEGIPIGFINSGTDVFDLYQQLSYKDGDEVYVAENTTSIANDQTQLYVEVQLKEGSFLLGDCYRYQFGGDAPIFFTSSEHFIKYCKEGWKTTFASMNTGLTNRSADEVFKYPSLVINDDGSVTVNLRNEGFTTDEQKALVGLSNTLSGTLKGYRDGKMYFHYKINHDATHGVGIVRNNAYNLKFTNVPAIGDPVPTPIN